MQLAELYPKDINENYRYRDRILTMCEDKKTGMDVIKEVKIMCIKDVLFFINTFCWALDPFVDKGHRHGVPGLSKDRPIVTYPYQDKFILELDRCISTGENIIADKSRDMLASYMVLMTYLHGFLFKSMQFKLTSWKEDFIDKEGDMDTLFEKLRYNLRRIPWFLLPAGWHWKSCSSFMRLKNPETGSVIIGESATKNLGSGGRKDSIFFDELSKWETNAREAWSAASDSTKCKIGVWTPKGVGSFAAELMRGDMVKSKHRLMWWLHPEKTYTSKEHLEKIVKGDVRDRISGYMVGLNEDQSPAPEGCYVDQHGKIRSEWYDGECESRDANDIRENLDCDYLTSGNPVFDTLKCQDAQRRSKEPQRGDLAWKVSPRFDNVTKMCLNADQLVAEFFPNANGSVYVWEMPDKNLVDGWNDAYCISADCAEGLEQGDYNSANVLRRIDRTVGDGFKPRVVASIHGHHRTFEYAEMLAMLGVWYGEPFIAPESNNTQGGAVINELFSMYRKIYHSDVLNKGYAEKTDRLGFNTNHATKGTVIKNLSKAISNEEFEHPDTNFWSETMTFVNNDGKMEAQGKSNGQKCFDDRVMSTAILLWVNLNVPPPFPKRKKEELHGWRKQQREAYRSDSLVRFV